jgi:phosphatidylglycerophosphate synthase
MSRTGTVTPVVVSDRYADTLRQLASAQKVAAPGAPAYSIYVNRKIGRYIAAAAFRVGLSPNVVTLISAVFTFTGITAIAVAPPLWWVGILVWLLLATGYAFDSADGQVARLRGGGSPSGEWLDHVVDAIKISTLHLAVLITFFTHFRLPSSAWLLVPLGFTAVASVAFFAMILNDLLKSKHGARRASSPRRSTPLRAILGIPTDYGVLCLAFVLLGVPWLFVGVYTVLFAFNAVYLALALVKWFTDMVALGRAEP